MRLDETISIFEHFCDPSMIGRASAGMVQGHAISASGFLDNIVAYQFPSLSILSEAIRSDGEWLPFVEYDRRNGSFKARTFMQS
jgi:hypothetical protein